MNFNAFRRGSLDSSSRTENLPAQRSTKEPAGSFLATNEACSEVSTKPERLVPRWCANCFAFRTKPLSTVTVIRSFMRVLYWKVCARAMFSTPKTIRPRRLDQMPHDRLRLSWYPQSSILSTNPWFSDGIAVGAGATAGLSRVVFLAGRFIPSTPNHILLGTHVRPASDYLTDLFILFVRRMRMQD